MRAADGGALQVDLVFPRFKLLSGAERAILGLAAGLVEAGHRPRVICHQFDDSCRARLAPGVELVVSGARLDWTRNRYLNAVFDYTRTLRLAGLLNPAADVGVYFGPALLLASRRRARRPRRAPFIYYCWEPPRVLFQDRREVLDRIGWLRPVVSLALSGYRRLDRRLVAAVDAVVTSSPFAAEQIERCYGRTAAVITLGVDAGRLDAARRERPDGPPRLLTVNYLHPRKRVDLIIEALALIGGGATLVVVGDGPERERLGELARRAGVGDRVEFVGFVADEDLPAHYWEATCYVHATRDESFGLSVIEASFCGLPVVAVDEGGVRDTVDEGTTGYRVAAAPEAIAAGISRVLRAPDRGVALGERGRAAIEKRFRWSRGVDDLLTVTRGVESGWSGGQ